MTRKRAKRESGWSVALIVAVALFFAGMGLQALGWPEKILGNFGLDYLPPDLRNEVRAVYGGYGIAISLLLLSSLYLRELGQGFLLAVAVSVLGMAGGRMISFEIEPAPGPFPLTFLCVEIALATALLVSYRLRRR